MSSHSSTQNKQTEKYIVEEIRKELSIKAWSNEYKELLNVDFDFYYSQGNQNIVGEVYCSAGKLSSGSRRKLMNDAAKMVAIEKLSGKSFQKFLILTDNELLRSSYSVEGNWRKRVIEEVFGITVRFEKLPANMAEDLITSHKKQSQAAKVRKDEYGR